MADVIIIYDSKTGNTAKAAEEIGEGVNSLGAPDAETVKKLRAMGKKSR
jgi:flavodoxin